MISSSYLRVMARYNKWQNGGQYEACDALSEADRQMDRGAFWGSIHGTLSHLYWGDQMWFSRLGIIQKPSVPLPQSGGFVPSWRELSEKRRQLDDAIVIWADEFPSGPVVGTINWFSGAVGREVEAPLGRILHHVFNHQTHHRGQAHALITAAGVKLADTDLFIMPSELWPADAA